MVGKQKLHITNDEASLRDVLEIFVDVVNNKEKPMTEVEELWETIEWLNSELEKRMPKEQPLQVTEALKLKVLFLLADNKYIDAIRMIRQTTNWRLKESKEYVDIVRAERNKEQQMFEAQNLIDNYISAEGGKS